MASGVFQLSHMPLQCLSLTRDVRDVSWERRKRENSGSICTSTFEWKQGKIHINSIVFISAMSHKAVAAFMIPSDPISSGPSPELRSWPGGCIPEGTMPLLVPPIWAAVVFCSPQDTVYPGGGQRAPFSRGLLSTPQGALRNLCFRHPKLPSQRPKGRDLQGSSGEQPCRPPLYKVGVQLLQGLEGVGRVSGDSPGASSYL